MKDKIKTSNYFSWGLTLFLSIGSCILLYFIFLRLDDIIGGIIKLIKILSPILIGILFAYLLNPLVRKLEKSVFDKVEKKIYKKWKIKIKKLSRILSMCTTYFVTFVLIYLFIKFVIPSLLDSLQVMVTNIPSYINNIYDYLNDFLKSNPELAKSIDKMNANINDYITNIFSPSLDSLMNNLTSGITNIVSGLIDVIIGLIVSIYLLYDKETFINNSKKVLRAILPNKIYEDLIVSLGYTDKIFGGFMIAKIIDSLIIGVLTFIIITLFKIPYALIISVIVGVTNIIPYFGPFIGAIPCGIFLLLISPRDSITFLILIFLIQQFDGNILGPKLIGNKTGIKSFWVLFSILLFGGLFGFVGMIFGVPVFAIIYSIIASKVNKRLAKKYGE